MKASMAAFTLLLGSTSLYAQSFFALPAVDGQVRAFAASGNTLYIGGDFGTVGGETHNGIAAIDLTTGNVISGFAPSATFFGNTGSVHSIAVSGDGSTVYFGGNFNEVGGSTRGNIAAVTAAGTLKNDFAPMLNDSVGGLQERNGVVYAVGNFTQADGTGRVGFASFNSTGTLTNFNAGVTSFNTGANFRGLTLSRDGSALYVALGNSGVDFLDGSDNQVNRRGLVALDTTTGRATDFYPSLQESTFVSGTFAVHADGTKLLVGGPFDTAEGNAVHRIVAFDDEVLDTAFNHGPNGSVRAIATQDGGVFVAGAFTSVDGETRTGLAKLDIASGGLDPSWNAQLDTQLSSSDTVMFAYDGKVFIGGGSLGSGASLLGQSIQYYGALTAIPEPASVSVVMGLAALGFAWRRRRTAKA